MHAPTIDALRKVRDDVIFRDWIPAIPMMTAADGTLDPVADDVPVATGKDVAVVAIPGIEALFAGRAPAPDLSRDVNGDYLHFLLVIERTGIAYCESAGAVVTDQEFERLYRQLRRRPDGRDDNPLFSYLRAAARLFMAHRDTSQAEFEAVAGRLERSARRFSDGSSSTNYFSHVSRFAA